MNLKKIQMHAFIVNFFKVTNRTSQSIYTLLDAIAPVERAAGVIICESLDSTLESLLEPILTYPEHFELSLDAGSIKLKNPETLNELSELWPVDSSVTEAIRECLKKYEFPMMYAGVSLDYAAQNEKYISSGTKYIDWLWDRLEQNYRPNTRFLKDSCRRTAADLANIARISNLHTILSRYYSKNLMDYCGDDRESEAYIFHYSRNGEQRYFKVERQVVQDIRGNIVSYAVKQHIPVKNAPYFPDVVLGVPSELLEERKKVYDELKELFKKAKSLSLRYDAIQYDLGIIYGRIDDPRD
ncbi:MAG: hypothetical protein IJ272_01455 [Clostridia bacterium]|nr:hypothetical protein [Clostridia bacterium]